MPNHLAAETSPYLLQHANNPVEWYPWGTEALERARAEDKPILLSIGYAACHWCHVMERESFENEETAKLMNELFVNIKVDREERPDLDAIYMAATQAMTGHGGWPMTVILTPDGTPFYAGTYFPPDSRPGMPAFTRVLRTVRQAYDERRGEVDRTAESLREMYRRTAAATQSTGTLNPTSLERAYRAIAARYDARHGGFEGAPKFPQSMALDYLLRYWRRRGVAYALEMALASYRAMARGGIYDQIGGGFARYAVDAVWLVPHFEKMLYDNALLIELGAHLVQATGDDEVRRVVEETITWVAREMTSSGGGFFSSLDADSEGEEGKFYVWSDRELSDALGEDAAMVKSYYGVTPAGNFEGHNILHVGANAAIAGLRTNRTELDVIDAIARAKVALYDVRATRVWPARDEKILASWNGLMVRAISEAARVFARDDWRDLALRAGEFLFREMVRDGRVMRTHRDGVTKLAGYLEDHGAVGLAALALYELTLDEVWLSRAREIAASTSTWFWDEQAAAFYDTASDHERLVTRPREVTDNAVPSGTSLACDLLQRIAILTDDDAMRAKVARVLESVAEPLAKAGPAFGWMAGVADMAMYGATEVALIGDKESGEMRVLHGEVARHYLPGLVLAAGGPGTTDVALLANREALAGTATAYVCRRYSCDTPVTEAAALGAQLESAPGAA
ncbi:MAG: thioredoxin domain-containing protein [Gemmatimonadota bacterium]|nr:thioredoxin domain-containing protein [Gemmatimonadota bacterium]